MSRIPGTLWPGLAGRLDLERSRRRSHGRLDLGPPSRLLERLGRPESGARILHVAGSKGKGSLCHLLERGFRAAGLRTGLYTSPHLVDWSERIRIGGAPAGDAFLEPVLARVLEAATGEETLFDLLTVAALLAFREARAEVWILETGLGGRLDSTNAVAGKEAAAVTSIEREHAEVLGPRLQDIAREKAGIFRSGAWLFSALSKDHPARPVLLEVARDLGEPLHELPQEVPVRPDLPWPQEGLRRNHAFAVFLLQVLGRGWAPAEGAACALQDLPAEALRIPGRYEEGRAPGGRRVVLDTAHTAESLAATLEAFRREEPGRRALLLALRADKDPREIARVLGPPQPDEARWVCPAGEHPASADPRRLAVALGARPLARPLLPPGDEPVLVTGSTYLVGALRPALTLPPEPGPWAPSPRNPPPKAG